MNRDTRQANIEDVETVKDLKKVAKRNIIYEHLFMVFVLAGMLGTFAFVLFAYAP